MLISDWSSDVCSSDLGGEAQQQAGADQFGLVDFSGSHGLSIVKLAAQGFPHGFHVWHQIVPDFVCGGGLAHQHAQAIGDGSGALRQGLRHERSEEHTSDLQSLMRTSYAVFCLNKKKNTNTNK